MTEGAALLSVSLFAVCVSVGKSPFKRVLLVFKNWVVFLLSSLESAVFILGVKSFVRCTPLKCLLAVVARGFIFPKVCFREPESLLAVKSSVLICSLWVTPSPWV